MAQNPRFTEPYFPDEATAQWWMDTVKRRRFVKEFGDSHGHLFRHPWPRHIRGYWDESEVHIKRVHRFRLITFLIKNGISAKKAVAYVADNTELSRGRQDDYDDKAIRDFDGFIKEAERVKLYPTFDTIDRRSQWDKPYGYLER